MSDSRVIPKKIINTVETTVEECLQGFSYLFPQLYLHAEYRFVSTVNECSKDKVALISGGGSGHEPFATGYVGRGMLDGAVAGGVFTSPPSKHIFYGIKYLQSHYKGGVLVLIPNYTGDRLNFGMAVEKSKNLNYEVESVILGDDLASKETMTGRRGMCGMSVVYKIVGALTERGINLKTLKDTTLEILENMTTLGASLTACSLPGQSPLFEIDYDELELGTGVHGEAGTRRTKMCTSKELVDLILTQIIAEMKLKADESVVLFVNNLGAVSVLEMNIVCNDAVEKLKNTNIKVERVYSGPMMTSLDMVGIQICLLKIPVERRIWLELLDMDTDAPAWIGRRLGQPKVNLHHEAVEHLDEEQFNSASKLSDPESALFKSCLKRCADVMIENELKLNKLDSGCGDGDCGTTLKNLSICLKKYLEATDVANPGRVFSDLSEMSESSMGGTSGAIYSLGFSSAASILCRDESLDRAVWLEALENALQTITKYGGAKKGDRTMMDTLTAVLTAFKESTKEDLKKLFRNLSEAASKGCESTAKMQASVGRASYVTEERWNDVDAGAKGTELWINAINDVIQKL